MSNSPYAAARVARQAKWFALAKVGVALVALVWQFVLVRELSINGYASFTIFIAANGVLVFVTMFGMDRVVYRFMPPLREAMRWREIVLFMGGLLLLRQVCIAILLAVLYLAGQTLLPQQLLVEAQALPWYYVTFAIATGCTESFSIFSNSLGLQGRQAMLLMASTALRFVLIVLAAWHGALQIADVALIVVATEAALALALALLLGRELGALRRRASKPGALAFGFSLRTLATDSLSTQLTYMLGLPFRGSLLKLIVGAVATPLVTASFGFFQAMADRAYQFMPMFLMKGMLEPALASDYSRRGDFERIRLTVSLLLRLNYVILGLGLAMLLGCGEPLIHWITNGRYGSQVVLACLILLQLAAMTLGEALWIALNPIGRIAKHNALWLWFSLLCYGGVAAATMLHSTTGLLLVSVAPYLMVFAWLRWVSREACLQGGLGMDRLGRLLAPMLAGVLAARAPLSLSTHPAATLLALACGVLAYGAALRLVRLFDKSEVDGVAALSPRLARMLRFVSP